MTLSAAFIGAASGYFLANISSRDLAEADRAIEAGKLSRAVTSIERRTAPEIAAEYERAIRESLDAFTTGPRAKARVLRREAKGKGAVHYRRLEEPRGPMIVFGYDYFAERAKSAGIASPKLLNFEGSWGTGEEYAYEALNFADGRHDAQQIADELSAEFGPVPLELVVEYLQALKAIGVVE